MQLEKDMSFSKIKNAIIYQITKLFTLDFWPNYFYFSQFFICYLKMSYKLKYINISVLIYLK